jgi:glyoxylase-like metal-dependent hydrolase (beta-lactamase superfamily II)
MAAYPTLAIIAQEETKKDMDLLQVSLRKFAAESVLPTINAYKSGKYADGTPLPQEQVKRLPAILATLEKDVQEYKTNTYQGPTLTFKNELDVDLGNVDVKVMFLGRGHTSGDAVVYLPKQRILIAGDLLVSPLPFFYSGYPSEFVKTLEKLAQFDADTIVPGHGEIEHDKKYLFLIHDFLKSAVDQVNARLAVAGPAVFLTLDQVKGEVDLSSFKQPFIGSNPALNQDFDDMAANAVKLVFTEASLR